VAGIVLCGGRSTRMGRAKAWLPWGEEPLLVHVVRRLRAIVAEIVVVSSQELELPKLDARVVRDREPELGPLSGIREGLAAIDAERAFVTATDTPALSAAFVHALLERPGAVAPEIDGHVQTLAAVYPRSALEASEARIAARQLRPLDLLEAIDFTRVAAADLPDVDSVRGFNTPDSYLAAVRCAFGDATATLELLGHARHALGRRSIEVPVGTLRDVLNPLDACLSICDGDAIARPYLVSLDGREFVRSTAIPIGPGERVVVLDASVGG
jgi:molybdopterin-guanine dinucleotide biosynthesis protein A